MNTTHDDDATTWRDLADQLTLDQITSLECLERDAFAPAAEVAAAWCRRPPVRRVMAPAWSTRSVRTRLWVSVRVAGSALGRAA